MTLIFSTKPCWLLKRPQAGVQSEQGLWLWLSDPPRHLLLPRSIWHWEDPHTQVKRVEVQQEGVWECLSAAQWILHRSWGRFQVQLARQRGHSDRGTSNCWQRQSKTPLPTTSSACRFGWEDFSSARRSNSLVGQSVPPLHAATATTSHRSFSTNLYFWGLEKLHCNSSTRVSLSEVCAKRLRHP